MLSRPDNLDVNYIAHARFSITNSRIDYIFSSKYGEAITKSMINQTKKCLFGRFELDKVSFVTD